MSCYPRVLTYALHVLCSRQAAKASNHVHEDDQAQSGHQRNEKRKETKKRKGQRIEGDGCL